MRYCAVWLLALLVTGGGVPEGDIRGTATFSDKPVADAVVWLEAPGTPSAAPRPKVVLDQRNLHFYPRVLVVQVGTVVEFPNHDRVFHDVFSFRDGKQFELGLYPVGAVKHVPFDRPGLSRVFCNIHPAMAAYILVVDSPYFAVTDRDGRFTLSRIAEGTFTYHAWRPGGAILNGSAALRPGSVLDVQWR
jgi:plastocyanin